MISFVLFYKLCERGEGTLPLYLVDKGVPMAKLAFWNGIVRSAASIGGSTIGSLMDTFVSYHTSILIQKQFKKAKSIMSEFQMKGLCM